MSSSLPLLSPWCDLTLKKGSGRGGLDAFRKTVFPAPTVCLHPTRPGRVRPQCRTEPPIQVDTRSDIHLTWLDLPEVPGHRVLLLRLNQSVGAEGASGNPAIRSFGPVALRDRYCFWSCLCSGAGCLRKASATVYTFLQVCQYPFITPTVSTYSQPNSLSSPGASSRKGQRAQVPGRSLDFRSVSPVFSFL